MAMYPTLRNGNRGAVTPAQLGRERMQRYSQEYAGPSTSLGKYPFSRTTTDYIADGDLYRIECEHPINSVHYTWSCVKTNNSGGVLIDHYHQGAQKLTLWFTANTLDLAITIIG